MSKVNKISVCCQKVLPLVYDESLSYYEVLCKVQQKLNELIKINNQIRDEVHKEYVEILEVSKQVTDAVASTTKMRDEVLTLKQATEQYAQDVVTVYNETVQARDQAKASATQASASASTASTKASQASGSATSASNSAKDASASASSASSSASSASNSASRASTSATTATQKAATATAQANIAKDNADKVITAMSLVAGTVNLYRRGDITINVSSSDAETITATVTPTIRNNVLYMNTLITQVINGVRNVKLPNIVTINLNMQDVFTWMASKLANVNRTNLPIVTYGGSRKISLNSVVLDTFNSSASGRSTGSWNYPVQLQVFGNNTDVINIESGRTERLYYNVTIAQPLTFQNEETPTPTDYIAKLGEETTAREQADTALQANIDSLSNDTFHKTDVVPIANGGTGASDADTAFANLVKISSKQRHVTLQKTEYCDKNININVSKKTCLILPDTLNIASHTTNVIIAKGVIDLPTDYNIEETLIDARGVYFNIKGKELQICVYPQVNTLVISQEGILFNLM